MVGDADQNTAREEPSKEEGSGGGVSKNSILI